ncbi:MAG: hypothetical protein Kilf2KO_15800 [Rhodospirillales bacterium]
MIKEKYLYRLGLDLGANSLGWSVIWLDEDRRPIGLGPAGVRIHPDGRDPQSKSSNAVTRRVARGARRRRDRYLRRRKALMEAMIAAGLLPAAEDARKALVGLDPYDLRARGLREKLPLHHLGRALFHLNQRRGFKSNRKTDGRNEEAGAIAQAAQQLDQAMLQAGARTLGDYLAGRRARREAVRARNVSGGVKAAYDFYPQRALLEAEFRKLWTAQAKWHPELSEELGRNLFDIVFFQRPLTSPPVGKCVLDPAKTPEDLEGFRCPWAQPQAQRFRILQEVTNLAVGPVGETKRALDETQRFKVVEKLRSQRGMSFEGLRRLLKLPADQVFNLESERRSKLEGDATAWRLAHKARFGKAWQGFGLERQAAIVTRLLEEPDEEALVAWLRSETGVSAAQARAIADAPLPEGHCRLGLRALRAILPHLEAGLRYHEAAKEAGYDHAKLPTGEIRRRLPYYGEILQDHVVGSGDPRDPAEERWGRLPNPTVHIGLNQLRRVVNALIRRHGPPDQVVVELARDFKLSPRALRELELEQRENQAKNDARRVELERLGRPVNHGNLLKLRLWEELNEQDALDRACPFTGERIGIETLLSDAVEIEHLIPFSKSWDDSAANKTVCYRRANRAKGQKAPHQAFGDSPVYDGHLYDWEAIAARAAALPANKRWRFDPDALERFQAAGGFLKRQLNETSWLARLARQYLGSVTSPNEVYVVPGRLTALLRRKWGLEDLLDPTGGRKNRNDHRHHALDALVAGMTDRGLLQRLAREYDEVRARIVVPPPWDSFRQDAATVLRGILVSHKPDHGAQGKLHEDTAYGVNARAAEGEGNLLYRKPVSALTAAEIGRIRDPDLRAGLQAAIAAGKAAGAAPPSALADFAAAWGRTHSRPGKAHGALRHVRLAKLEGGDYLVPIQEGDAAPYKVYSAGENHCVEIYETPAGRWRGEAISLFQANQPDHRPAWRDRVPGARFVMRVHKGDCLRLEDDEGPSFWVVHILDAAGNRFRLAKLEEAGRLQNRHDAPNEEDSFRWRLSAYSRLQAARAELVRIDEIGRPWRLSRRARS